MIGSMQLSSTLSWLVDAASETPGVDRLLAEIGAHLVSDGLPLAGGALTMAVPHPLIARRSWLWRAESGEVIEALGFVAGGPAALEAAGPLGDAGRRWLAELAPGVVHEDAHHSVEHLVFFLCELLDGMVGGLVHDAFDDCPLGCDVRGSEAFQNRCWVPAASHAIRPFLASRLALKSPLF